MKLKKSEFTNCSIYPGSVVVSFELIQAVNDGNETLNRLNVFVANNVFTLKRPDGSKLNTVPSSVYVADKLDERSGEKKPVPQAKKSDDSAVWAIVILVLLIIGGLILILLLLRVLFKQKEQKVSHSNILNLYTTLIYAIIYKRDLYDKYCI